MYKLVFLIAAAVVVDCQVNFFAVQYATVLNVTCEFQNNLNFLRIISLVITKSQDGVDRPQASITSFNTQTNHLDNVVLLSSFSYDVMNAMLTLQWHGTANSELDGTYTCTMVGLDVNDLPFTRSKALEFKWDDLDPVFIATPTHIVDVLTPSLILECTMINKYSRNNTEVDKIEIYKNNNGVTQLLAYANSSKAAITTLDNRWTVIGSYLYGLTSPVTSQLSIEELEMIKVTEKQTIIKKQSNTLYLAIKLTDPTMTDAGKYVCDFSSFRADNETETVSNGTSTADNGTSKADNGTSTTGNGTDATENGTGSTYNSISTSHSRTGIREHILKSAQVTASGTNRSAVSAIIQAMEPLQDYYLYSCNFEKGSCGLNVTTTNGYVYSTIMEDRVLANGRNQNGHYLHNEFQFSMGTTNYEMLIVETQLIPARTRNICVNVWLRGSSYAEALRIYVRNNNFNSIVWSLGGNSQFNTGIEVKTQISSYYTSSPFILSFEFQIYANYYPTGSVSIDDILVTDINCG